MPFDGPAPYRPWANYWCKSDACQPAQYGIGAENRTQTGGWSQGSFPRVLPDGRVLNGGIPQRANLTYHVQRLTEDIDGWIPDVNAEVHAVIDFECWTPVWENNNGDSNDWHGKVYRNLSITYATEQHPNVTNTTEILELAQEEFETAAVNFFVQTMEVLKKLRPKALWGYYGFPYAVNAKCIPGTAECGYDNPTLGPMYRARNDRIAPVWQSVKALYPSIYLIPQGGESAHEWQRDMQTRSHNAVLESIRLSRAYAADATAPAKVLPFYWPLYHNGSTPVDAHDLKQLIAEAYIPPLSTQLIIWDGGPAMGDYTADAFRTIDGPVFRASVEAAERCTKTRCSDHGWCDATLAFPGWAPLPAATSNCTCYPGFTGDDCSMPSA